MPFEKGNQAAKGRANPREFADMLRLAIREASTDGKSTKLRELADALVKEGLSGNVAAIKEIGDRLDGKVPQALIGGGEDDPPIKTLNRIEIVAVEPRVGGPTPASE